MRSLRCCTLLIMLALAFAGCASSHAPRTTRVNYGNGVKVSGVITYRERMAMPAGAVVTARLVDVSLADAKGAVLCEQVITNPGQIPVPFVLNADAASINENHNYAIEASITVGGQARWRTAEHYGVITRGNPLNGLMIWVQQMD